MIKKIASYFFASLFLLGLLSMTACNTIAGAGKDIEKGGEKIKDTANENK